MTKLVELKKPSNCGTIFCSFLTDSFFDFVQNGQRFDFFGCLKRKDWFPISINVEEVVFFFIPPEHLWKKNMRQKSSGDQNLVKGFLLLFLCRTHLQEARTIVTFIFKRIFSLVKPYTYLGIFQCWHVSAQSVFLENPLACGDFIQNWSKGINRITTNTREIKDGTPKYLGLLQGSVEIVWYQNRISFPLGYNKQVVK